MLMSRMVDLVYEFEITFHELIISVIIREIIMAPLTPNGL